MKLALARGRLATVILPILASATLADEAAPVHDPPGLISGVRWGDSDSDQTGARLFRTGYAGPARRRLPRAVTTRSRCVLVVDDEPDIREILKVYLTRLGYEVRGARSRHITRRSRNGVEAFA